MDRFFEISARGSTVATEIRGGVVTFIAMAYIIVLNPIILSSTADIAGHKLAFGQVSAVMDGDLDGFIEAYLQRKMTGGKPPQPVAMTDDDL